MPARPAPIPPDEAARLAVLRSYDVLDTAAEESFDVLTRLAAQICGTPMALVSLVDADRQWFKSKVGLEADETPREIAFCSHAILQDDLLVVPDAREDDRFADNPLVTSDPHLRFYAGSPLVTSEGQALGTLCVLDRRPRELTPGQREALGILARQVVAQLELRRKVAELRTALEEREQAEQVVRETRGFPSGLVPPPRRPSATRPHRRVALAVALVGGLLGVWGAWTARSQLESARRVRLAAHARQVEAGIRQRLAASETALRGSAAVLAAGQERGAAALGEYVRSLGSTIREGGLAAIGYAEYEGGPPAKLVVRQVEPPGAVDTGLDLRRGALRRSAIDEALETRSAVATSREQVFPDDPKAPGVFVFLPVVTDGPAEEKGMVFALVPTRAAFGGLAGATGNEVDLEVFDASPPSYATRLYDEDGILGASGPLPSLATTLSIDLLGREWLIRLSPTPEFAAATNSRQPLVLLLSSLLLSLLAGGAVWYVDSARAEARAANTDAMRVVRASEDRVRAVVDNVADAIVTYNEGGAIQTFNAAAERMFGYSPSVVLGRAIETLIPHSRGDIRDGFHNESTGRRQDGSAFPIDLAVTEMREGDGTFFIALIRDITERRRAEEELRESETRTRAVIHNMLGGLITSDAEGRIETVNPAAERIFGYSRAELIGQPLAVLLPDATRQDARSFMRAGFRRAIGRVTEWEGRRNNGEVFPFELSFFDFHTPGGRHFAGNVRDLSDLRAAERMKKEFVSTVSHELRTPLTSIRGSLGLLAAGALGELPGEATELVALAERNTIRLISLINDILDLERLETGRMEMRLGTTSLQPVVERSLDALGTVADTRGVTLLTPSSFPEVVGDQDRLVQVLVNLLSNAVKFSPEGGTVTVGVSERPGWVEVTVRDQGRGVPAEHRQAIFERFRQVEASDARRERGAGLGLSICKAIINRHGGEIGVLSAEGGGSTFWFRIPSPSASPVAPGSGRAEVLVCVQDPAARETLGEVLRRAGYQVRLVSRPDEAVGELRSRPPALVVVEAADGDGSGLELLDALGLGRELSDVPVVVLGDHMVFPSDEPPQNVTFFLPRPPDETELLRAIRRSLAGRRAGDVILVDDDEALLDVMARQLSREGVQVRTAATGREAVRLVRESCPTLLVLDVGLPDLDGFDVVEALRGDDALEAIPLLVYTGRDLSGEQRRRLRLGPTRFVTKSKVTDDAFRDLVIELLHSSKAEGSSAS